MRLRPQRLSSAAILIAGATAFRTAMSLATRSLIAARFGIVSGDTDAYLAAFTLPQILGDSFVGGAAFFAILPVLTRVRKQRGAEDAWRLLALVMRFAVALLAVLTLAYALTADRLIPLLAPGFDRQALALAVYLARYLSPTLFLMGMTLIASSVIQSHRHFVSAAVASMTPPLLSFLGIYLFGDALGILSWALGTLAGELAQFTICMWALAVAGMSLRRPLPVSDPAVRDLCRLTAPLLLGVLAAQITPVVQRVLASRVPAAITALNYSRVLMALPLGLGITPLLGALFPFFAEQAAERQTGDMRRSCAAGIRMILFLGVPASVLLIIVRQPLVALLFEWGRFGPEETRLLARMLLYHSIGIPFVGCALLLTRAICSLEQSRDMLALNLCAFSGCGVNWIVYGYMGAFGLAVADTVTSAIILAGAVMLLSRRIGWTLMRCDAAPIMTVLAASVVAGGFAMGVSHVFGASHVRSLVVSTTATAIGFVGVAGVLRSPELHLIWSRLIEWSK